MIKRAALAGLAAFLALGADVSAHADGSLPKGWTEGPVVANLGGRATIQVPVGYVFLDVPATRKLLRTGPQMPDGRELGAVLRTGESGSWFAVFSYADTGHIDDGEQDALDASVLLSTLQESQQRLNVVRAADGRPSLTADAWHRPPAYGPSTHRLTWSTRGIAGGQPVVNYAITWLGREGVMSAHLIAGADTALVSAAQFAEVMVGYAFAEGSRYGDFREGDRTAGEGLTTAFAAGVVPHTGEGTYFPTFWSGLVLVVFALVAAVVAWLRRRPEPAIEAPSSHMDSEPIEPDTTMAW